MCGKGHALPGSVDFGRQWRGRFKADWIADDLAFLRADSTTWPSPANVLVVLDGDGAALIDCGFGTHPSITALEQGLRTIDCSLASVHTLVSTHPHTDHAGGLTALAEGRRLLAPEGSVPALNDPSVIADSILPPVVRELVPGLETFDADGHFRADCGAQALAPYSRVEEIHPEEVFTLGKHSWRGVPTPGHDAHLFCYLEVTSRMLVYSDLLVTAGTAIPWYAPGGGGTAAYRESLRRVGALRPQFGVSGHGGLLEGPAEIATAIDATARRIEQREDRIAAALAKGPATFEELEQLVYPPAVNSVIPWASSVAATHLVEALESGRVRRHDDVFEAAK